MSALLARTPIEPLRSCPSGRYQDEAVTVRRVPGRGPLRAERGDEGRIVITHALLPGELDDELAAPLAAALAPLTDDHEVFARAFTGVVVTSDRDAATAWQAFYANTLALLGRPAGADAGYAGVYRRALELLPTTSVVDLGCSFGFLSMHLADRGTAVTACDVDPGTVALLRRMSRRLRRRVDVLACAPDAVPLPANSADGVALLHVLEHVDAVTGEALLGEALRIARRRVVIAVPYENEATALYGHVRRFDDEALRAIAEMTGLAYDVDHYLGGWLVLHLPDPGVARSPARLIETDEGELQ